MVNPPHSLKTPRFLVTGANGQLGFELQRALAPLGEVVACGRDACDLSNPDSIRAAVRAAKPEVIFSAGAYTAVDKAESEPDLARAVNATAPGILGEEAAKLGALVIHYSTDYVFDGAKLSAYSEEDATNPLGVYGKTKLEGEKALAASGADHLIFRTSWVIGAHGKNFIKTILRLASNRDELRIVADQFGAPTGAALLADASTHIATRYLRDGRENFPFGLYHLAASGEISWHGFAQRIVAKAAAARDAALRLQQRRWPVRAAQTGAYQPPVGLRRHQDLRVGRRRHRQGRAGHPQHDAGGTRRHLR